MVHAVQLPFDSLKSKLAREGNPKLPRVCDELGVGYRRTRVPIPATELHHLLALPPVYLKPNLRGFGVEPRGRGSPLREEPQPLRRGARGDERMGTLWSITSI